MKTINHGNVSSLIRWELQEYLNFPLLEIVIFIVIYSVLNQPIIDITSSQGYSNLHWGLSTVYFFMILGVCTLISRSFGSSFSKGEVKLLLSYPLKRWQIFVSKFVALYTVFLCVYIAVFWVQIYLLSLSFFEPLFFVSIFSFALQLLLTCSVTAIIVMIVKNEVISIFASILLLYGLENVVSPECYLSFVGRFDALFGYFGLMTHGSMPTGLVRAIPLNDAMLVIFIPVVFSAILLTLTFVYYVRVMEVD